MYRFVISCLMGLVIACTTMSTDAEAQTAREIKTKITNLGKSVRDKDYAKGAELVAELEPVLNKLKGDKNPQIKAYATQMDRTLQRYKKTIIGAGFKIEGGPAPAKPTTPTPGGTPVAGKGGFTETILPIFAAKCRACHMGNARRGNFSMASYNSMMAGVNNEPVISPGDGTGSHLYSLLESGDMPRGNGPKVTKEELAAIAAWIKAGAKYDGENPELAFALPRQGRPEPVKITQATGNEKISFSRDIAPVLVQSCIGCHGGDDPSADFDMDTFQQLLAGGDQGQSVEIGNPDDSYIIAKLKGTAAEGQRMPRGQAPLSDEVIAKFELWIKEGAKFDGPEVGMDTRTVVEVYIARNMTHDELAEKRFGIAQRNWSIGNPDIKMMNEETKGYTIVGNVVPSRLKEIGEIAEKQEAALKKKLGISSSEPLFKGKLTVFVFGRKYQYSEHAYMVEKRRVPSDWRGHWNYNIVDAYAALAPPKDDDLDSFDQTLTEAMAGAYLESKGKVPNWFAQGAARALAAELFPKSSNVAMWNELVNCF